MASTYDIKNLEVTDKKYSMEKIKVNSKEWAQLWQNNILIYQYLSDFWAPRLEVGKKCMEYAKRIIFTQEQLKEYEKQDKIPVQPQEMKKQINIIANEIGKLVQASTATTEDDTPPENAMSPEDLNIVLEWIKQQVDYDTETGEAKWDGLLTGYPQWVWFDKEEELGEISEKLTASHLQWDSTLCSQYFKKADGSDIDEVIRVSFQPRSKLYETYPDRVDAHKKHIGLMKDNDDYLGDMTHGDWGHNANDRPNLIFDEMTSSAAHNALYGYDAPDGYEMIIERFYVVQKKQKVYISEEKLDAQIMPPDWSKQRIETWKNLNPDYNIIRNEPAKTLWVTTISSDGMIWENNMHWFQKDAKLPGKVFIPSMIDKMPIGIGEDMLPIILSIAVSDTEGLNQVRLGSGMTTYITEGSLKYPHKYKKEANAENGMVHIRKNAGGVEKNVKVEKRTPNSTFFEYGAGKRQQLQDVNNINDAIAGRTNSRQSQVAKQTDINQGLGSQSPYVKSYSHFELGCTQLIVDLIPYVLTEERVITIKDEFGMPASDPITVNQEEFDEVTGEGTIIANDLITAKYRIVPVPGEDTETSRKQQLVEFTEFITAVGNTLFQLPPAIMGNILSSVPNTYMKMAGQTMTEFAQSQQESQANAAKAEQDLDMKKEKGRRMMDWFKMNTPKLAIKMDGASTEENTLGTKAMMEYMEKFQQFQMQLMGEQSEGEQSQGPPPPQLAEQAA